MGFTSTFRIVPLGRGQQFGGPEVCSSLSALFPSTECNLRLRREASEAVRERCFR